MPTSKGFGKQWIDSFYDQLCRLGEVKRVVDVGAGCGTYINRLRTIAPTVEWTGIEIWGPYIEQYSLKQKYDRVILQDVRAVDWDSLGKFDVAFLGDVLEHMRKEEATALVTTLLDKVRILIVSLPVLYTPQGVFEGNAHEIHVESNWSHEGILLSFPSIRTWYVEYFNGVYFLSRESEAALIQRAVSMVPGDIISKADIFGGGKLSVLKRQSLRFVYFMKKLRPLVHPLIQIILKVRAGFRLLLSKYRNSNT